MPPTRATGSHAATPMHEPSEYVTSTSSALAEVCASEMFTTTCTVELLVGRGTRRSRAGVHGGHDVAQAVRHAGERFGVAGEQQPARAQVLREALHQGLLRGLVEVDHDVAAEDE